MGCLYSDFTGHCQMLEIDCIYEEDSDPSQDCECYESDYQCSECYVDLNVSECKCEKESFDD
jgi:hypothetical protein